MCGVAAVSLSQDVRDMNASALTAEILDQLRHRGPDGHGVTGCAHTALGMTRLRVRSAPSAEVPFADRERGVVFAFNGELYRDDRRVPGGGLGEARSALAASDRTGAVEGMYALVCAGPGHVLRVARDPLGIKPLYLRRSADGVAVASELPALTRVFGRPTVRAEAFAQFLLTGRRVVDGGTLFEHIRPVAPGESLTVRAGRITTSRTQLPDNGPAGVPDPTQVRAALEDAVDQVLLSERRIGLALSGGLDSTILAALLARRGRRDLRTVSVVVRGTDDGVHHLAQLGLASAELGAWRHAWIPFGPADLLDGLPAAVGVLGEPTAMTSVPMYAALARLARASEVTVLLVGEGADELFGGYNRYRAAYTAGLTNPVDFYLTPERSRLVAGLVGPAAHTAAVDALKAALAHAERVAGERCGFPASAAEVVREFEYEHSLEPLLRRTDHLLMAEGIEGRTPFLHGGVPALARRYPVKALVNKVQTKVPLRHAYADLLPGWYQDQAKRPFRAPIASWLSGPLFPRVDEQLDTGTELLRRRLGLFPDGVRLLRSRLAGGDPLAASLAFALLSTLQWLQWLEKTNVR